ncbi:MAG TPA: type II toxin-antitoxin system prevent-host-death family antitoxin [Gammaproteobacteria bacterium]|nr:type II toxin-antitoxin system prevent-host-death family antitoxin [Gammaproteobacteria bacterium]
MHEINVTELRKHLHQHLASVQKKKELWVTWHGKVIARILPPLDEKKEALNQLKKLRGSCKVIDVISGTDEKWEAD